MKKYTNNHDPYKTPQIPRIRIKMSKALQAREELKEQLGREPTDEEVAELTGFDVYEIRWLSLSPDSNIITSGALS